MKNTNIKLYLIAVVVGIGGAILRYILHVNYGMTQAQLADIWLQGIYPAFIVLSLVISFVKSISPWKWALTLTMSDYIGTASLFGSQAPPFEILFMLVIAVPYVVAAYLGGLLKRIFERRNRSG